MRSAPAAFSLLAAAATASTAAAQSPLYRLQDAYVGGNFLSTWNWQTFDDPTHGDVNYVDLGTALAQNLTYASLDKFVMRADSAHVVQNGTRGRSSVRIHSQRTYTDSLVVLDLQHMPAGCATWPAFWSYSAGSQWPNGGEIDMLEGVNLQVSNQVTLHTAPNCSMPDARAMSGRVNSTDCDANANYNQGCAVSDVPVSYGADFNAAGGGYYVMERGPATGIRAWFWSREDAARAPDVVRDPAAAALKGVQPDASWGLPVATFPMGDNCDYEEHFDAHQLVFDLTFCGDWAGQDYTNGTCPGECSDLVVNHPEAFAEAYWEVDGVYVYTPSA